MVDIISLIFSKLEITALFLDLIFKLIYNSSPEESNNSGELMFKALARLKLIFLLIIFPKFSFFS